MSAKLSVEDVLSTLEARAVFHRDQEAFHAEQEVHHREQRALHAAELARVQESLESFRAAAPTALELARERVGPVQRALAPPNRPRRKTSRPRAGRPGAGGSAESRRKLGPAEALGPTDVAAEVNRRYRGQLKRPIGQRAVSRRAAPDARRRQHRARPSGKAFHEALYRAAARRRRADHNAVP